MAEVASFLDVSQFISGKSAYECVAYSASLIYYCGPAGHGATGTTLQASNLAQYWYGKEEGSTTSSNTNGMSVEAEYNMLQGMGLHYYALSATVEAVKTALQEGFPVMLCGAETGMHDLALGDRVPYAWTPTGNHCIVASGIASDGNLLVHDCASIAPSGVRPGPRVYDASKLQIVSATAVIPRWKGTNVIPTGWHDDGTTLVAPNGVHVVLGFRAYVLSHNWDTGNIPLGNQFHTGQLEGVNPGLGAGDAQYFRWIVLQYNQSRGVFEMWTGMELQYTRNKLAETYNAYQQALQQIQSLQSQVKANTGLDATKVKDFQTALELQAHDIVQKAQLLETAIIAPLS